ncbi:hypothetical protein GCM10009785_30520 [Brooklawnia cerclae]|uniref:DUF4186 domain-containing protein n=1 Tax=Brooklawnia cerclae TaxID=349934 RepID=A0ABX0SE41_9ACTN|nr:DUF4186 domain-containing protein [Brooklawnia cerclae]NIH56657.1 hypothetical protein [Brooklawnia cerclae]
MTDPGPVERLRTEQLGRVLDRLATSSFRSRFHLTSRDRDYARARGREVIAQHAAELLKGRVGAAEPANDGKQTPYRGHPVFIAQHATATCCRGCIARWHHIPAGTALTEDQLRRLVDVVMAWIERELVADPGRPAANRTRRAGADGQTSQREPPPDDPALRQTHSATKPKPS